MSQPYKQELKTAGSCGANKNGLKSRAKIRVSCFTLNVFLHEYNTMKTI